MTAAVDAGRGGWFRRRRTQPDVRAATVSVQPAVGRRDTAPDRRTHFLDDDVNAAMARDGFVVLPQRLAATAVDELARLYSEVIDEVGRDTSGVFLPSMMITRPDLRARLWDGVGAVCAPVLDPLFTPDRTRVMGGSFVAKPASEHSARNPHQDPSVFDEREHVAISVWIPLTDSDPGNGTLHLLPGSHRMGNHIRPPDVPNFDDEVSEYALASSVPVTVAAGEMLVIDGAVIHHSPPNDSADDRVAVICALRPVGAAMSLMRSEQGAPVGTAELYDVDVEMFRCGDLVNPALDPTTLTRRVPYRPATMDDLRASLAA